MSLQKSESRFGVLVFIVGRVEIPLVPSVRVLGAVGPVFRLVRLFVFVLLGRALADFVPPVVVRLDPGPSAGIVVREGVPLVEVVLFEVPLTYFFLKYQLSPYSEASTSRVSNVSSGLSSGRSLVVSENSSKSWLWSR